jgi:hypothetical protein
MLWKETLPKGKYRNLQKQLIKISFLENYNIKPEEFDRIPRKFLLTKQAYDGAREEKRLIDNAGRNQS